MDEETTKIQKNNLKNPRKQGKIQLKEVPSQEMRTVKKYERNSWYMGFKINNGHSTIKISEIEFRLGETKVTLVIRTDRRKFSRDGSTKHS